MKEVYVSTCKVLCSWLWKRRTPPCFRYSTLTGIGFSEGVPAGTHLLEVVALGYFFSPVRVDVSSRLPGQIRASYVEGPRRVSDSLVLEPLREENYYEIREPFSMLGLLKSPMGLMIGFMVICVFLLPMLMDSIDPEEMKRLQEAQRSNPSPLAQLMQGRS